jgi:hypothetical protein
MLVSIPVRVEDFRQRSWLVEPPDIALDDLVTLVKAFPKARFLFVNGPRYGGSPLGKPDNGLPANYWLEISRLRATMANDIGQLVSDVGADRVVFGTGMPFKYPDPALVKMDVLDAPREVKEKIYSGNALKLLAPPK